LKTDLHLQFDALASPVRLSILSALSASKKALTGVEICEMLSISESSLSKHLKRLTEVGLVHRQDAGRYNLYLINYGSIVELMNDFTLLFYKEERFEE
jgi:DNA-binding transcriptional ArsR family regulator